MVKFAEFRTIFISVDKKARFLKNGRDKTRTCDLTDVNRGVKYTVTGSTAAQITVLCIRGLSES